MGLIFPCLLEAWSSCSQSLYTFFPSHTIPCFEYFDHLIFPPICFFFLQIFNSFLWDNFFYSPHPAFPIQLLPFLVTWLSGYRTFFTFDPTIGDSVLSYWLWLQHSAFKASNSKVKQEMKKILGSPISPAWYYLLKQSRWSKVHLDSTRSPRSWLYDHHGWTTVRRKRYPIPSHRHVSIRHRSDWTFLTPKNGS